MNRLGLVNKDFAWGENITAEITAASAQTCARECIKQTALLQQQQLVLQQILGRLDQLGTDGVHDVIRTMRTEMRAQQRARRQAARAAGA